MLMKNICSLDRFRMQKKQAVFPDVWKYLLKNETVDSWFVECSHSCSPPAKYEEIRQVEDSLGQEIPNSLKSLLLYSNGASLFSVPYFWLDSKEKYIHLRLFSSEEIITTQYKIYSHYRQMLGNDPDFQKSTKLNYITFCDAHDGNYLAMCIFPPDQGNIFVLDHELFYRPYTYNEYELVVPTLEIWLEQVSQSYGFDGLGVNGRAVF